MSLSEPVPTSAPGSVLVLGGAGYIGSTLTRQLLADGWTVRVLDALFYGPGALTELGTHQSLEFVRGDSRDPAIVQDALRGMDAVVHVAELVGDPACAVDPAITQQINYEATCRVAEMARDAGVRRFVYPSSCSVYGASDEIVDEDSTLNPVSLYAETKIRSEAAIRALTDDRFEPVILRLATVFGFSARPRFDLVVNLLAARALVDGEVTLFGGSQWRPFIHVADVASAMRHCLTAPASAVAGQTLNVGADFLNYTIGEIADLVLQATPTAHLREVADPDARNYRVAFDRIRERVGFTPTIDVPAGIAEVQAAIAAGRVEDYRAAEHSNVKSMQAGVSAFAFPKVDVRRLAAG